MSCSQTILNRGWKKTDKLKALNIESASFMNLFRRKQNVPVFPFRRQNE